MLMLVNLCIGQGKKTFSKKICIQYATDEKGNATGKPDTVSVEEYKNGKTIKFWTRRIAYEYTSEVVNFFDENGKLNESITTIFQKTGITFKRHRFFDTVSFATIKEIDLLKEDQTPFVAAVKYDSAGRINRVHNQSDYTIISYSANDSVITHKRYDNDGKFLSQQIVVMDGTKTRLLSQTFILLDSPSVLLDRFEYNADGLITGKKGWFSHPASQSEKSEIKNLSGDEQISAIMQRLKATDLFEEIKISTDKNGLARSGTKKIYEQRRYKNYILKYIYR